MTQAVKSGDFTDLAEYYINRVGYSPLLLKNLAAAMGIRQESIIADVGAGTGKLTENLLELPCQKIFAVEPNDAMRRVGMEYAKDSRVVWSKGSGEATGLPDACVDFVFVGSAFHWMDTPKTLKEFSRILKKNGHLTVLWNPRDIKRSPLHERIEKIIYDTVPNLKRVSSGFSDFTETLFEKLVSTGDFADVFYMEAKHEEHMTKERYMGAWKSVNDIQAQAGPENWEKILERIEQAIAHEPEIITPYRTRAWTAQHKSKAL
ncbi:MAG: methyltransferase domain-containing protein [Patescibacteria group bacterium]